MSLLMGQKCSVTKVANLDFSLSIEQDIIALQITMDVMLAMDLGDAK